MFTGIVETTAAVLRKTDAGLVVARPASFDDLAIGASVCVSGACLSVVEMDALSMRFDVIPETWAKTSFGDLREGDSVNLERSLKASARLEGHVVQGHVEGVGRVVGAADGVAFGAGSRVEGVTLTIELPLSLVPTVIPKGSIAIDGVSLTVAALEGRNVTLALIPHTLTVTTLGRLRAGSAVNVETDIMLRWLAHAYGGLLRS